MYRQEIAPYVLHAALHADLDEEAGTYATRPTVEIELPAELDLFLVDEAARLGCDPDALVEAILHHRCDVEEAQRSEQ